MIMYQLFETNPPFSGMDPISAAKNAAMYDLRPQFVQLGIGGPSYKTEIKELIESCWRPNGEMRPSFESIVVSLETILAKVPGRKSQDNGGCCTIA